MTFRSLLQGAHIADVHVDSELTYLMLSNGTQVTIRGLVVVQPVPSEAHPRHPSVVLQAE
ncbi:MAG: hypothetical protein ABI811_03780 [Acidobacteriota bacterium]